MSWREIADITGPEGPQGKEGPVGSPGNPGAIRVLVETGAEERPDTNFVIWMGGDIRPENMMEGDLWFTQIAPSAPALPPVITTMALNTMIAGTVFQQTLAASGEGIFTWSAADLPAGLSIDIQSGVISGTPTTAGSGTALVSVASTRGGSASKQLAWSVVASATVPSVLAAPSPPSMQVGKTFTWTPGRSGTTPMTWGVSAGSLPAGLSISSSTGAVSGTPLTSGAYTFTLQATNSAGSNTREFTGTITPADEARVVSVFGSSIPGVLTSHNDAGPGSWIAHQFYVPSTGGSLQSAQIVGARLYVPAGSPVIGQAWRIGLVRRAGNSEVLINDGTGRDFDGQDQFNTNGALTQGSAPLVAGWNEQRYSQKWAGLANRESAIIGIQIGDGTRYLYNTSVPASFVPSESGENFGLSETGDTLYDAIRSFYRGSPSLGSVRWYGIDILVEVP